MQAKISGSLWLYVVALSWDTPIQEMAFTCSSCSGRQLITSVVACNSMFWTADVRDPEQFRCFEGCLQVNSRQLNKMCQEEQRENIGIESTESTAVKSTNSNKGGGNVRQIGIGSSRPVLLLPLNDAVSSCSL